MDGLMGMDDRGGRSIFGDVLLGVLQMQRKSGKYCDVRLEVGPHHAWTHSAVMCALSPFISDKCCEPFSLSEPLTIKLYRKNKFDCFRCLQALLDIIYGQKMQKIECDAMHAPHLYALCKLLNLSELLVKSIRSQMPKTNVSHFSQDASEPSEEEQEDDEAPRPSEKKKRKKRKTPSDLSGKRQACIECPFKCIRPSDLLKHLRETGHGGNVCSLCLGRFDSPDELKAHYAQHDDPKPFFCLFCDLRFQTRALFSLHLPKHTKETPYRCTFCGKGFKWKHGLNSHVMIHSNEKKHLCDECGFSTMHAKTMRAHRLQHSGELFRCSFVGCTHTCSRKENMKTHLCTHVNYKPFVCEVCGRKFKLNYSLKRHALVHSTAGLANACPHCPFRALRADKLKAHILRQHRDKSEKTDLIVPPDDDPMDLALLANAASSRSKIEENVILEEIEIDMNIEESEDEAIETSV